MPSASSWFRHRGIAGESLTRRPFAKACLDWSERRHHLAGALDREGAPVARAGRDDRGRQVFCSELGIDPRHLAVATPR